MSDAGMNDEVLTEVHGSVLVITLNRPEARNAMTRSAAELVASALTRLDDDPDLAVGVLTGGTSTFCAGMDLKRFQQTGERPLVEGRGFGGLVETPPAKPLIAAVEGWALGGGFEMAFVCDLVVAGESAKFGLPEVKRGLIARAGGVIRAPRALPRPVAMELLLTGEPMTADTAKHFGVINRVAEDGQALQVALELASAVAANAPLAVRATKALADASRLWPDDEAFTRQVEFTDPVFASQDAKEGPAAFAERRTPRWTGR